MMFGQDAAKGKPKSPGGQALVSRVLIGQYMYVYIYSI